MKRVLRCFFLGAFLLLTFATGVYGEYTARNPLNWLNELEINVLGNPSNGNLIDRLTQFELSLTGRSMDDSLIDRLFRLETLLYSNRPHDTCLLYKLQALEWVLYHETLSGPIMERVEKIETYLYNQIFSGPVTKRLDRLISQIYPEGTIQANWVSVPEGLLVKVKIIDELSSINSKVGDQFKFLISETVTVDDYVLFPKGSSGVGIIKEVKKPSNLGRDARLLLDFVMIRAIDSTPIKINIGSKSSDLNRSYQLAVGASAAGMLAFGPEGILFGLAVKGKDRTIATGTEFYLQISESVRIYSLKDNRR
ncbi:MAG: hypothetical protein GXY86_00300 [Firmicutes bacterium]|nr:hypothetical protein [Bacillota bacterium]